MIGKRVKIKKAVADYSENEIFNVNQGPPRSQDQNPNCPRPWSTSMRCGISAAWVPSQANASESPCLSANAKPKFGYFTPCCWILCLEKGRNALQVPVEMYFSICLKGKSLHQASTRHTLLRAQTT